MIREMAWYDAYLSRGQVDRSANTTPGNKKGGLSNIVEKAMGSIVKSGSVPISGVLAPGEKLKQKGLIYAATPASDFICGTLQLAAGMNLHVFSPRSSTRMATMSPSGGVSAPNRLMSALLNGRSQANVLPATSQVGTVCRCPSVTSGKAMASSAASSMGTTAGHPTAGCADEFPIRASSR